MKFGFYINGQQEENTDLHYVEYKLLKKRLKDVVARLATGKLCEALSANTAFEEALSAEINHVNACFDGVQKELLERIAALSEDFEQEKHSASHALALTGASSAHAVPAAEDGNKLLQHDSFLRLVDILKEVDRFRKFAVWNAVAVVKILKKRRKQTKFGLDDSSAERAGWLSRQRFFGGFEFAELHAAIESLGHAIVLSELSPGSVHENRPQQVDRCPEQCAICLDTISDMVELDCKHRFCWKCFVLGPIAFQPGEYRMTQCPVCRSQTTKPPQLAGSEREADHSMVPGVEGMLTRFLHTYFPKSERARTHSDGAQSHDDSDGAQSHDEMIDVVGELVKVIRADTGKSWPGASSDTPLDCASQELPHSAKPRDFFETLPNQPQMPQEQEQEQAQLRVAQKLQWLQLASSNDPFAIESSMYCSLCSELLLMEAVVTTPCKHHFHKICIKRLDVPNCPLCHSSLPFSWFLPSDHPLVERGFPVVPPSRCKPLFLGGPSKDSHGYPLHCPPPANLLGPGGTTMRSYLHRLPAMGSADAGEPGTPRITSAPSSTPQSPDFHPSKGEDSDSSESSTDAEATTSEVHSDEDATHHRARSSREVKWAYSATGRMRLCSSAGGTGEIHFARNDTACAAAASDGRRVLLIGNHL